MTEHSRISATFPLQQRINNIETEMFRRLSVPLTSFAGGLMVGVYYSDDLQACSNLASNRLKRASGLPATPNRDISSILAHSREIIEGMHLAVLATTHRNPHHGEVEPDARVIYSSTADGDMTVVFNTTKHSRKYAEIMENPHCSLTFVHKPYAAYVTMKGEAHRIDDNDAQQFWSDSLDKYYAHDRKGFTAWRFVPEVLEIMDLTHGLESTRKDFKPITMRRDSKDLPWVIESTGRDEVVIHEEEVLIR